MLFAVTIELMNELLCKECELKNQSKNILRIFEPHFMRKVKNSQPQQEKHYSDKKKSVSHDLP